MGFSPEIQTDSVFKNALIICSILISQRRKKTNDGFNICWYDISKISVPIPYSRRKALREIEINRNSLHMKKSLCQLKVLQLKSEI